MLLLLPILYHACLIVSIQLRRLSCASSPIKRKLVVPTVRTIHYYCSTSFPLNAYYITSQTISCFHNHSCNGTKIKSVVVPKLNQNSYDLRGAAENTYFLYRILSFIVYARKEDIRVYAQLTFFLLIMQ